MEQKFYIPKCYCSSLNAYFSSRKSVVCKAVDLKDFGLISDADIGLQEPEAGLKAILDKLPEFKESLTPVPDRSLDFGKYVSIVNANDAKIIKYIKANATKAIEINQPQVDLLLDPSSYSISNSDADASTRTLTKSASMFSRFDTNFMKAVSSKTQVAVTLRDQYKGLSELDEKDASDIEKDVRRINYLTAKFSGATSGRGYIEGTSLSEKREDLKKYRGEVKKAKILARIVGITVEQIPPKEIFAELFAFERDPQNITKKRDLERKVAEFKNKLIKEAKAAAKTGSVFDLDDKLKKE